MKNIYKILPICTGILALIFLFSACKKSELEKDDYDILLPEVEITDVNPLTVEIESEVTVTGSGLEGIKKNEESNTIYYGIYIGNYQLSEDDITELTDNRVSFVVPRLAVEGIIRIINVFQEVTETEIPLDITYPSVSIDGVPDTIFISESNLEITGTNTDLITSVEIGETVIDIDRTKQTSNLLTIPLTDVTANNAAVIRITALSDDEFEPITGIIVMENYPWAELYLVAPDVADKGSVVSFVFDDFTYADAINNIRFHSAEDDDVFDASFVIGSDRIDVTVPNVSDTLNGDFTIATPYESKDYTGFITVNPD